MYKDISVYSPTKKPEVVDIVSVQQSLLNLIFTRPGQRPFDPDYGIDFDSMLFDLADDTTAVSVFNDIVSKVKRYEPRVVLSTSLTDVTADLDNNRIDVKLVFEIVGLEGTQYEIKQAIRG